jgi:hypothetical protein
MEIAVDSFFIVFIYRLDELGPPIAYRRDGRNVVVYDTRPEAEDAAVALTASLLLTVQLETATHARDDEDRPDNSASRR